MGMTINKAISWLLSIAEHEGEDIPIYDTDVEAIKMGIETMRKYQQIIDAMFMNDMVENIYFEIEEILKDDLEQDERFGK